MEKRCEHTAVESVELESPPPVGEVCSRAISCPSCGAKLQVEYIKTYPMIDDIVLSPRWYPRGFNEIHK